MFVAFIITYMYVYIQSEMTNVPYGSCQVYMYLIEGIGH